MATWKVIFCIPTILPIQLRVELMKARLAWTEIILTTMKTATGKASQAPRHTASIELKSLLEKIKISHKSIKYLRHICQ